MSADDRKPVRMLFVTDEELAALVTMAERGISDAYYYASYVDGNAGVEEEEGYAESLRRSAQEAERALEAVHKREKATHG